MYSMELKLGWSRGSSLGTSCLIAACSVGGSTMGGGGSAGLASMATEGHAALRCVTGRSAHATPAPAPLRSLRPERVV